MTLMGVHVGGGASYDVVKNALYLVAIFTVAFVVPSTILNGDIWTLIAVRRAV